MSEKDESLKAEILAQAQKLFQRFGLNKTTMEDIAKAAGKGKSTLYYYYKSKEEIFSEVVMGEMDAVFALTRKAVDGAQTAEDKLRTYSVTKFRALQEKANLYQVVKEGGEVNYQLLLELKRKYAAREISLVQSILLFGLETKEFAGFAAVDVEDLAFAMVCAGRGIEIGLLIENRFADLEERVLIMHNIVMKGLKA
jgi:AcrR family transcriptional regulator